MSSRLCAYSRLRPVFNIIELVALLGELSIPDNRMTGVLSTHFQSMTSLRELDVAFNYFKGNFDEIFGQLSKMSKTRGVAWQYLPCFGSIADL